MSPNITKIVRQKLGSMDDDMLIAAIRVFCSIPAKKNDMFIETKAEGGTDEGLLMRTWEELCYDEALSRGLDEMLEQAEELAANYREHLGLEEVVRYSDMDIPDIHVKPVEAPTVVYKQPAIVVQPTPEPEIEPTKEELAAEEKNAPELVVVGADADDDFANIGFQKHNWQGFQYTNNFRGNR